MYNIVLLVDFIVRVVQVVGLKRSNLPVHSINVDAQTGLIVGGTMDGPFIIKNSIEELQEQECQCWWSDFGYERVVCASVSLQSGFLLASFREFPPMNTTQQQPSRHVIVRLPDGFDPSNRESPDEFWEFKSQNGHKMPFKSAFIADETHFQVFLPDESTSAGNCYLVDRDADRENGCKQLSPIEVYPTNAGIAIVDCCVGRVVVKSLEATTGDGEEGEESRDIVAFLTEKHLYLYSN